MTSLLTILVIAIVVISIISSFLTVLVTGLIVAALYGIWRVWNFIINDVSRNIDSENR